MNAVALEDGDAAVIATDRKSDGEAAARVFGAIAEIFRKVDGVGGFIELAAGHLEDVGFVESRNDDFGHGSDGASGWGEPRALRELGTRKEVKQLS